MEAPSPKMIAQPSVKPGASTDSIPSPSKSALKMESSSSMKPGAKKAGSIPKKKAMMGRTATQLGPASSNGGARDSANGQGVTNEAVVNLVAECNQAVQQILHDNCEQATKMIKDHVERLASSLASPKANASPDSTEVLSPPQTPKDSFTNGKQSVHFDGLAPLVETDIITPEGAHERFIEKRTSVLDKKVSTPQQMLDHLPTRLQRLPSMQALEERIDKKPSFIAPRETIVTDKQYRKGVFADEETLKRQARENGCKPEYNVCDYYWETGHCQAIARSYWFEVATLSVIAFNAIWMGYDIDANTAVLPQDSDAIFIVADNFFCFYFVVEWVIRFGAFEVKRNGLYDFWMCFDFMLCVVMVIETWALMLIAMVSSSGGFNSSIMKTFRLIKMVRLARLAKLLNAIPELLIVVKGIGVASRAVACTFFLLLFICYVFAIVMRQSTDGSELGMRTYPTVLMSMRFLLTLGCAPDLLVPVNDSFDEGALFAIIFSLFIIVIVITVMNMLVGILVGVMHAVATVEKEEMLVSFVRSTLMSILQGRMKGVDIIDVDGDESISKDEFVKLLQVPCAIASFERMGVDVAGLVELTDFIFAAGRAIPFHDFMDMVLRLRGSNLATVKDIVDLRHFLVVAISELHTQVCANREHRAKAKISGSEEADHILDSESGDWLMAWKSTKF